MEEGMQSRGGVVHRRRGEGLPVVLIHGIPGVGRGWAAVERELPGGLDVITPDLLGFGRSDSPPTTTIDTVGPAAQAAALGALLDELGVAGATLVGHDFGAPVAALLAHSRPDLVAGLVLLAGNTFPDTPIPFPLSLTTLPVVGPLAAAALFSSPSLRMILRQGTGPDASPPDADVYLGDGRQRRSIATIFGGALTRLAELYAPVEQALHAVGVPSLVGWGDRDPFFPLAQGERTAAALGAPLHVFERTGHFVPHERPVDVARCIEKVVTDVHR